jgi:DNA helicase-2/ATP-dependent DNA helicase PcrA
LDSLNEEQRNAVVHSGGPLLVFAGAGSGKTRVIAYRIAHLIAAGIDPSRILAVTFTNKAAKEMRHRVESLVGANAARLWMGTFHRVCGRILRERGEHIGISHNIVIYDDDDQIALIKLILKSQNLDEKSFAPRAVLSEISRAKEALKSPEDYSKSAIGFLEKVVADVYQSYQSQLYKNQALDFDDMIAFTVRLLRTREDTRKHYQSRFQHVLVDEFQDVNAAQYDLIRLISPSGNVTIVGDDDQSIYAWRGADVSHILGFAGDFENAKVVKLEQNYRSTQRILSAANAVIVQNRARSQKSLWTQNVDGSPVSVTELGTETDEAMLVADVILREVRSGRRQYGDFAVLYRANAQSRALEEALLMMRIPHVLIGGQRFYERKEVRDILAYLRLVANPLDDVSLRRVINVPTRGVGDSTIAAIADCAGSAPMWTVLRSEGMRARITPRMWNALQTFVQSIELSQAAAVNGRTEDVVRAVLHHSGYMQDLRSSKSEDAAARLDNLQELLNVAVQHDAMSDEPGLIGFLQEIALLSDVDAMDDSAGGVTLMTAHAAKGLEFPVVFIVGAEEGVFPHSRSMGSDKEVAEERRLFYVAMTRAREELHITLTTRRLLYGRANFNTPSRFIAAIPADSTVSLREAPVSAAAMDRRQATASRPLRSPEWRAPFESGQQVRHAKFGVGVVVACIPTKGDCEVTVAFPGVTGMKKLMQGIAKLEPV